MNRTLRFCTTALLSVPIVGVPMLAQAQPAPPPPPSVKAQYVAPVADAERKDGWTPGLIFGATINVVDNRGVVGQPVGTGFSAGYVFDGALNYNSGAHEWRNALLLGAGTTHTPAIAAWVKTRDVARFETLYLYHVAPWIGPFGRFAVDTQMFAGSDPRAAPTTYQIARPDGTTESITGTRLHLNDPFKPTTLKQSLGVFVQPYDKEKLHIEGRVGAGAQEVFADGSLALADKAETPDFVEATQLFDYQQVGAEALAEASGTFRKEKVSYKVGAGVMIPLSHSALAAGDNRSSLDLTNVDLLASLSFKLFDWASLDYQFRALRQPQLVDTWQVSNNLLLTIGLAVGSKAPKEPPVLVCPPAPAAEVPPAAPGAPATPPAAPAPATPATPPAAPAPPAPPAATPPPAAPPPPAPAANP